MPIKFKKLKNLVIFVHLIICTRLHISRVLSSHASFFLLISHIIRFVTLLFEILLKTADLWAGHTPATRTWERDCRYIYEDHIPDAFQRDRLYHPGSLLFPNAEEQVEHLQDAGKGRRYIRIRRESLPIEGHLRSCVCSFRRALRFTGTAVARLLQVSNFNLLLL